MFEFRPIINALLRAKSGAILLLMQIAITTAIVSNAAFIINDRIAYLEQETGLPEQDLFQFNMMIFGKNIDLAKQIEVDESLLRSIPGVIDAVYINAVPLSGGGSGGSYNLLPSNEKSPSINASYFRADSHVLNTLGVELVAGRDLNESDVMVTSDVSELPKVALVTQAMHDEMFPQGSGLGKTIYRRDNAIKIVGIIKLLKGPWLQDERRDRSLIFPQVRPSSFQKFLIRTEPNERAAVMRRIEDVLLAEYPDRVIDVIKGLDQLKAEYVAEDTLMVRMLMVLITVLVLITALGIFGLTLFNINKRLKQIGTRRALGARKSAIIRYFLVENTLICSVGVVLGSAGALWMGAKLMALFSLPSLSVSYVIVTGAFVILMSLFAVIGPAKRAADISPSIATRSI
ncbi:ABC transporter permease [Pseudoalteromonas aurantia]|uniref:ABC transport system permease protein n=1 Tax=Pseudoalteromonas aurantia 208 TaxID=1314867 RepID=A0ABR9EJ06_9GAMM|nr:FtsX-like permease family protein [Pseudoalteromonas aurantia]MBE0370884.1 putative ABC transport system permease protein [Pseudoalteromonas aurantia 208]